MPNVDTFPNPYGDMTKEEKHLAASSVRSNSQPAGGTTALQGAQPTGSLTPQQVQDLLSAVTPTIAKFRAQSSPVNADLATMSLGFGSSETLRLATAGLGVRLRSAHTINLNVSNSASSAQVVQFSPFFPYDFVTNTSVQLNAQTTIYSAGGVAGLMVAMRTRKGALLLTSNNGLNGALVQVTPGSGITLTTATSPSLSGYASMSVAASTSNATLQIVFYTFEKLAKDRTSLLGALALQNNSVYATLTRTIVGSPVGSNAKSPMYVSGGPPSSLTVALGTNGYQVDTTYDFWNIPSDAALYQDMVTNSYQVQEQQGISVTATGTSALTYDLPINQFITALHTIAYDNNGNPAPVGWYSTAYVKYNAGGVTPVVQRQGVTRASQFIDYDGDIGGFPGYALWDGNDTASSILDADSAGWIDTYYAANPQFIMDIAASDAVPMNISMTRESVVQNVQQTIA